MLFKKLQQLKELLGKSCLSFLEIIFPRFCAGCKKEGLYICEKCSLFISEANHICPVCQTASYFGKRHERCGKRGELDGLINVWDYDGVVKAAIHQIKYAGAFHALEEVVERVFLSIQKDEERFSSFFHFLTDKETYITFVPLSLLKEKERGFNQSEILANHIAKATNKKTALLLERIKNTKSQTGLQKEERALNIENAFSFISRSKGEKVKKTIIVDDVWTSGATMKECCRVLKENGVEKVWGFSIAKA